MKLLHATQIATKGVIGWTVGLSTKGYVVSVLEYTPPTPTTRPRTSGPANRGFRKEEPRQDKVIKVTVMANGSKWETKHVVSKDVKVGIEDIEIIEAEDNMLNITIRNVK